MGMTFGKIWVETPKYELLKKTTDYEIRKYFPSVIAEFTYDPSVMTEWAAFRVLTNYIGAFGKPKNTAPEKIAMTAPVITYSPDKVTTYSPEKIAMTAPVLESSDQKTKTMAFVLPSKYTRAEVAPRPMDERVVVRNEGERKYGVVTFAWSATEKVVAEKVEGLRVVLERDGFKVIGGYKLARYNPPWTLPPFRTMDVMLPVE